MAKFYAVILISFLLASCSEDRSKLNLKIKHNGYLIERYEDSLIADDPELFRFLCNGQLREYSAPSSQYENGMCYSFYKSGHTCTISKGYDVQNGSGLEFTEKGLLIEYSFGLCFNTFYIKELNKDGDVLDVEGGLLEVEDDVVTFIYLRDTLKYLKDYYYLPEVYDLNKDKNEIIISHSQQLNIPKDVLLLSNQLKTDECVIKDR